MKYWGWAVVSEYNIKTHDLTILRNPIIRL
jgi:hypothetical protein